MSKKTVFIVATEFDFSKEPRVIQEILALKGYCHLVGAGKGTHPDMDIFIDHTIDRSLLDRVLDGLLRYIKYYCPSLLKLRHRKTIKLIRELKPDVVSAHHLESAYIVEPYTDNLFFNSHEYIPQMYDGSWLWRVSKGRLIRRTMPDILRKAKIMYVESKEVRQRYEEKFSELPQIEIVPNAGRSHPELHPVTVNEGSPIRLVHHGMASRGRGLEMIIDAVRRLGKGYRLSLYLVGAPADINRLKDYASGITNVSFQEPVSYEQIIPIMNQYDIGLCMFRSENFHTLYTTVPNKFWEYLAARVIPMAWDKSAMAPVLREFGVGIITEENTVESIVEALNAIDYQAINRQKMIIHEKHEQMSAEVLIDPVIRRSVGV